MSLFLGLDLSTQQLKATVIDRELRVTQEFAVSFDEHFGAKYNIKGGVQQHADGLTVTVPTLMWVEALDALLAQMRQQNFPFKDVQCVSGTGQQHGSVYWQKGALATLQRLDSSKPIAEQLAASQAFSFTQSPIWMDSSTTKECQSLESAVGGPKSMARITGSKAYERFTGNQIAKLQHASPQTMDGTERIALVSSFLASLLIGKFAPIDLSDGSGMNLLNIQSHTWEPALLKATGVADLGQKLGDPVPSDAIVGDISHYFVTRYGFSSACKVGAFTGDNPASLAGMRIGEGDLAVSLGTSDTLFLWLNDTSSLQQDRKFLDGHVFCNPVDESAYMALLCYKNGSLVREHIKEQALKRLAGGDQSWDAFNAQLLQTPPGNNGCLGIYFTQMEITPHAMGVARVNGSGNERVSQFKPDEEIRALVEGQFMAKRLHAEKLGYKTASARRILATGGASNNTALLQVLANVFGAPVYRLQQANSASLGCAYRALHSWLKHTQGATDSFEKITSSAPSPVQVATPDKSATAVYNELLLRYAKLEEELEASTN